MANLNLQPYVLPSHWMSAVVNDDYSGIEDAEVSIIQAFLNDLGPLFCFVAPCDGESYFTRCHDAREYGIQACECAEVDIAFEAESEPDYDKDDEICSRYNSAVCAMLLS